LTALKAGENEKLAEVSSAMGRMDAALAEINLRAEATETGARGLSEQLKAAEGQSAKALEIAESADTGAKELATTMGGLLTKLEESETNLTALVGKVESVAAGVAGHIAAALVPLNGRLDGMDKQAAEAVAQAGAALEGVRKDLAVAAGNFAGLAEELKASETLNAVQDGRITAVAEEIKELSGGLSRIGEGVIAGNARLDEVERAVARQRGLANSALLSLTNRLRNAVDEGEPFIIELATIKEIANGDATFIAPIVALAPMAERGAPSLSALRREFNVVARKVIEAEEAAQPNWYARQWSNVQYYIGWGGAPTSSPAGGNGEGARTVLAQAANAINNSQFAEAVGVMATLQGVGTEHAQAWLAAARARVVADQAVRTLGAAALNRLVR
ncbi:hypothetical protein JZU48_05095, partial [bacterium]|nr:hypothetical protein [bacterium]